MKIGRLLLLAMLCAVTCWQVVAQPIPIGQWRYHSSFRSLERITQVGSEIFVTGNNVGFRIDTVTQSVTELNKVTGTSQVQFSGLGFDPTGDRIVIGYKNGGIDVINRGSGRIDYLGDLVRRNLTRPAVNSMAFQGDNAYIGGDYGLIAVNLRRLEINQSNTTLGEGNQSAAVTKVLASTDSLYLLATEGKMTTIKSVGIRRNLQNTLNYFTTKLGQAGLPPDTGQNQLAGLEMFQGKLHVVVEGRNDNSAGIYSREANGQWVKLPIQFSGPVHQTSVSAGHLLVCVSGLVFQYGPNTRLYASPEITDPRAAYLSQSGKLWVADAQKGFKLWQDNAWKNLTPEGLLFQRVSKLYSYLDKMVALPVGISATAGYVQQGNRLGYAIFDNQRWRSFSFELGNAPDIMDLVGVTYVPFTGNLIFASFGQGLLVRRPDSGNTVRHFILDEKNLPASNKLCRYFGPNEPFLRTSAVVCDAFGNLDITTFTESAYCPSNIPLHVYTVNPRRPWISFPFTQQVLAVSPLDVVAADNGDRWVRMAPNRGSIVVYRDTTNARIVNESDATGGLPSGNVNDIEKDADGVIWVATDKGFGAFYNPASVFRTGAYRISLPIFGGRYILENESIATIAIDAAGRKWVGTKSNGVFLFDKDLTTLLAQYTVDNSPLPNNAIVDIAIQKNTGEVFISTDDGLVSFRDGVTDPNQPKAEEACVFPNPVRPGYTGPVTINCLPSNAIVKIADMGGKLVYEGRANGGTFVWNQMDYAGRRARTGIYVAYAATDDGGSAKTIRFAIVE